VDSGLKSVSNSLSSFGVFFLAGGLVVPLAIGIIGCSSALLLLLIDSCIGVIKSNTGISFVVSCSGSSITSGDNSYCWYHRVILHAVEGMVTCCIC
jgi:hypothetical protein